MGKLLLPSYSKLLAITVANSSMGVILHGQKTYQDRYNFNQ